MPATKDNIRLLYTVARIKSEGLFSRLSVTLYRCYGAYICGWVNWLAIYAVQIHRNAKLIGIGNPF